jgi:hypothetical protein
MLLEHSAIQEGLVETGIPQVNVDQLNSRFAFADTGVMTQEQFDRWFSSLPSSFYGLVDEGGVINLVTASNKLTCEGFFHNKTIGMTGNSPSGNNSTRMRSNSCLDNLFNISRLCGCF